LISSSIEALFDHTFFSFGDITGEKERTRNGHEQETNLVKMSGLYPTNKTKFVK
jgi:hypothetical protein